MDNFPSLRHLLNLRAMRNTPTSVPAPALGCVMLWIWLIATPCQGFSQTNFQNPYFGSEITQPPTHATMSISLDAAIRMGLEHNLAVIQATQQQKKAGAEALVTLQPLLPKVTAEASRGAHQFNLEAQGFTPEVIQKMSGLFPGMNFSSVPLVVKADVIKAQVNFSQTLFNLPAFDLHKAAKAESRSAYYATESARGLVVLNVGNSYLEALAAEARLRDARALLATDHAVFQQAEAKLRAGVVPRLDELRARVQYQAQQQRTVAAENNLKEARILLKRQIGLAADQPIRLTSATPYASLATMSIAEATRIAYTHRQDYQGIQERIRAARLKGDAAKWERLPTLTFHGNYGVTGLAHSLYHGTFTAMATLNVPIFNEAKIRGDREAAAAGLNSLTAEFDNLKQQIGQQLRDSMLDVDSTGRLVRVASSSADLARQELYQSRQRFAAGVSDTLPVTQAQSTLAAAEANLVDTTMEYNQAKLGLARNLGIIATSYRSYLAK